MMSFITLLLLLLCGVSHALLNAEEALFLCRYRDVYGFEVPCDDARNACQYAFSGVVCRDVEGDGVTWNQTIISFRQSLDYGRNASNASVFFPTEIGYLRSLESLWLYRIPATFYATMPTEIGLCNLTFLRLRDTRLAGTIPTELFLNTRLVTLELNSNQFSGTMPSELGRLTRLETLNLISNQLSGTFPSEARNLVSLRTLILTYNQFTGALPDLSSSYALSVYRTDDNQFTHGVPSFNSTSLTLIDLSQNMISGTIPDTLLLDIPNRTLFVTMRGNLLSGTLPISLFVPSLTGLDLSFNRLTGSLPREVTQSAQSLEQLVLAHNFFNGSLPIEWHNFTFSALFRLVLHHNQLSGPLPRLVMRIAGGSPTLSDADSAFMETIHLALNDNAFSGAVPSFGAFSARTEIDLSNNQLSLTLDSFGVGTNITWINMAQNPIGSVPRTLFGDLTRFTELRSLDLSFCRMSGTLPQYFRAQYLKINNNYFTGLVPPAFITIFDNAFLPAFVDLRLNRLDDRTTRDNVIGSVVSFKSPLSEVILNDFPQDVDECARNTSECEHLCVDGWFPVPGYTCACEPGYRLDEQDKRRCHVVCGDGLLRYPQETCDYEFSRYGCSRQCTALPGYRCDAQGCKAICGDGIVVAPEECDGVIEGCTSNCTAMIDYACDSTNNTCQPCSRAWIPFTLPTNLQLFPTFRDTLNGSFDLTRLVYTSCIACSNKGLSLETRDVMASQQCAQTETRRALPCSFACSNLTVFTSALESLFTIKQEFERGDFLATTLFTLYGLNVSIRGVRGLKRQQQGVYDRLDFSLSPCASATQPPINIAQVNSVIRALALDIVPNAPNLQVTSLSTCALSMDASDPEKASPFLSALVGLFVALVVFLLAIGLLVFFYKDAALHSLPDDIAWSFKDQLTHPWRWEYQGNSKSGYYARSYEHESEEFRRVESILSTHFSRGAVRVAEITAVYNKALLVSFVNQWKIMTTRKIQSPECFFACTYSKDAAKMAVMEYFQNSLLNFWSYNRKLQVPLVPALHGTNLHVAEKIAQTGFAALSSLDAGYFGKGIYFTSNLLYTLPYACMHRAPAIILSYLNMGNVFPVTEDHKSTESLIGKPLKAGYNSHLVLTNKSGFVYRFEYDHDIVCDEIVIGQESQILPAFIIQLDYESCMTEFDKWNRSLPALPSPETTFKEFKAERQMALNDNNTIATPTYVTLNDCTVFGDSV